MCSDRLLPGVCGSKALCAPIGCCRELVEVSNALCASIACCRVCVEVRLCVLRSLVAGCA